MFRRKTLAVQCSAQGRSRFSPAGPRGRESAGPPVRGARVRVRVRVRVRARIRVRVRILTSKM